MNIRIKDNIKRIFYSRLGRTLRFLPEQLILNKRCKECRKHLDNIEKKYKHEKKIKVAFLLVYPEIWNSSASIFEYLNKNESTEAYIIALPKLPKKTPNEAYAKISAKFNNVIRGYNEDTGRWFDLKIFAPDYVFYTRPYAVEYPDNMKPEIVSSYCKLCYLTYGFDFTSGYHIEVGYNLKMMPYMHMIFCDGPSSLIYCEKLFSKEGNYKKIYDIGYPRFDLLYRLKFQLPVKGKIQTILWVPRWSLERLANDGSSYFDFIEDLLLFFSQAENKELNLIIRPHPLMFSNFVKKGVMSQSEVDDIYQRISKIPNVQFDLESDYLRSAGAADLVIADFTSLIIEYLMLDIPVIYCGSSDKFDEIGHLLDECMYHISDYSSVTNAINDILANGDKMKASRAEVINKISKGFDGKIGQRFVDEIIKDYYKE